MQGSENCNSKQIVQRKNKGWWKNQYIQNIKKLEMKKYLFIACSLVVGIKAVAQNTYTISSGTQLVTSDGINLVFGDGNLVNNGTLNDNNGTVIFAGAVTYSGSGTTSLYNFTINHSSATSILNNTVMVSNTFTASAGTLNANGNLTLLSTATNTARVANSAGTISGNVTVERYIPGKRAWRFLTAPLSSNGLSAVNVSNSWQQQTHIVGPSGTGLDATKPFYSMLEFSNGNWSNVSNTTNTTLFGNATTSSNKAFAMFLTGNRSIDLNSITAFNNNTLSATGKLLQSTQTFSLGTLAANAFSLVGNPYASPVDLNAVFLTAGTSNINRTFYTWDPMLSTTGGYVTISWNGSSYNITPSMGTSQTQILQSGQAFFVQATAAAATSVNFEENDKSTTNINNVFGAGNNTLDNLNINLQKQDGSKIVMIDGVLASFGSNFNKQILNTEDAEKLFNNEESISIESNTKSLSVERRPYHLNNNDTVAIALKNLTPNTNYTFALQPTGWDAGMHAYLVDKLLTTETPLDLNTTTQYINFTSTQANVNDRFIVVFRGTGALPNRGFDITGEKLQNNKVKINWEAKGEVGVKAYTLERSVEGVNYQPINTQVAKNNNAVSSYNYTDNNPVIGVNYYRVKTTQQNDVERYSKVITINNALNVLNALNVFPNPAKGIVNISTTDAKELRITTVEGKVVYTKAIKAINAITTVDVSTFGKGVYMVEVVNSKGEKQVEKLVISQ